MGTRSLLVLLPVAIQAAGVGKDPRAGGFVQAIDGVGTPASKGGGGAGGGDARSRRIPAAIGWVSVSGLAPEISPPRSGSPKR
jgi:hypothetical protein